MIRGNAIIVERELNAMTFEFELLPQLSELLKRHPDSVTIDLTRVVWVDLMEAMSLCVVCDHIRHAGVKKVNLLFYRPTDKEIKATLRALERGTSSPSDSVVIQRLRAYETLDRWGLFNLLSDKGVDTNLDHPSTFRESDWRIPAFLGSRTWPQSRVGN